MAQAQAVFSMKNKPTKKKKKKRRRKRPPSLVEMVEMKKGKVRPKKKRRTMLQQAKATTITTKQKDAKMFTSTAQSLKVISDYQNTLEAEWIASLKVKYSVSINKEVLYTLYKQ